MSSSTQLAGHPEGTCRRWLKKIIKPIARPLLDALARRRSKPGAGLANIQDGTLSASDRFQLDVLMAARGVASNGDHRRVHPSRPIQPARSIKQMRIGFVGNIANNAYNFVKCFRRLEYDCELVIERDGIDSFLMSRPFWEDLAVECGSYEDGLTHERKWQQPSYVRTVAFDSALQNHYQNRYSAISEVQKEYKAAFGLELPGDLALLLAQNMGHWPVLLALRRYDVIHLSAAAICLGAFLPKPYVVFPTGGDLFIAPFEENPFGLLMRAGYRRATSVLFCETNYPAYLQRLQAAAPATFAPLMIDTDVYAPGENSAVRRTWQNAVGGTHFVLGVCRQSWEWKGNQHFIRAFHTFVRQGHDEWRLILQDWGPDVARSKQMIFDLDLKDKVLWQPLCSKPVLRERQHGADVVADQFVMEGYGTSVLESMAIGKAVLLNPVPEEAMRYFHRPPPFVGAKPEGIRQALDKIVSSEYREQIGRASRRWIMETHGYQNMAPAYLAAYAHAVAGSFE